MLACVKMPKKKKKSIYTLLTNTKSAESGPDCCRGFESRVIIKDE